MNKWILLIRISFCTKFQLKLEFSWPNLPKKGFSGLKQKKWRPATIEFWILKLVKVLNFSSNWQFWFFGPNLPKKGIEHHHRFLHIWISLSTKFQPKLKILSFWTKFTQKGYFQWKISQPKKLQAFAFCVINVNLMIFWRSQKSHYFENFERKIGYLLPPGLVLLLLYLNQKGSLASFSHVTSANVRISPKNFLTFSFNSFATLV